MTFEDRLRGDIGLAVRTAPGEVTDLGEIVDRGRRRRNKKRILGIVPALALIIAMASLQLFGFTIGSEDVSVTVAGRDMPYSEVLNNDPVVVRGVEAEPPRFDTSHLGEEIPVVASALPTEIPDRLAGGAVFAGTVEGIAVFVYGDRVGDEEVFCVTTGGDSLCTDANAPGGGAGTSTEFGPTGDVVYGSIVGDLPPEVSVVAYAYSDTGEVIGWQTPVAYASYMPIEGPWVDEANITWEFYGADGQRLGTFGTRP
jgi:hypothetical protein